MTRLRGALLMTIAAPVAALAQPPAEPAPPPPPTTEPVPPPPASPDAPVPDPMVPEADPARPDPSFEMKARQYETTTTEEEPTLLTRWGIALSAGGGISGFTDNTARSTTNDGGGWDIRAVIGTRSPIAAEISYLGSVQSIDALGLDDDALLLGNGVQADLRWNLTVDEPVQPYVYAGAAWRRYDLTRVDTNTSDIADSDDVLEIPVGLGVAWHYRGLIIDARGEYRRATDEDLMPSLTQQQFSDEVDPASLHRWGVNANVGYEF